MFDLLEGSLYRFFGLIILGNPSKIVVFFQWNERTGNFGPRSPPGSPTLELEEIGEFVCRRLRSRYVWAT